MTTCVAPRNSARLQVLVVVETTKRACQSVLLHRSSCATVCKQELQVIDVKQVWLGANKRIYSSASLA